MSHYISLVKLSSIYALTQLIQLQGLKRKSIPLREENGENIFSSTKQRTEQATDTIKSCELGL